MVERSIDTRGGNGDGGRADGGGTEGRSADTALHLFGALRLVTAGGPVDLAASRLGRNLLAVLALAGGHPVASERLVELLWPTAAWTGSVNRLHVAVSRLRRVLRPAGLDDLVRALPEAYSLDRSRLWVDLWEFDDALAAARRADAAGRGADAVLGYEQALLHADGPLLAEEPYAEWVERRRDAVRLDVMTSSVRLAQLHLEAGRYLACVFVARTALVTEPADESMSALLITAYLALEQPHLALEEFRRLERVLETELGVSPCDSTRRAVATPPASTAARRRAVTDTFVRSAG